MYTNIVIRNIIYNKFQQITHCCWCMYLLYSIAYNCLCNIAVNQWETQLKWQIHNCGLIYSLPFVTLSLLFLLAWSSSRASRARLLIPSLVITLNSRSTCSRRAAGSHVLCPAYHFPILLLGMQLLIYNTTCRGEWGGGGGGWGSWWVQLKFNQIRRTCFRVIKSTGLLRTRSTVFFIYTVHTHLPSNCYKVTGS